MRSLLLKRKLIRLKTPAYKFWGPRWELTDSGRQVLQSYTCNQTTDGSYTEDCRNLHDLIKDCLLANDLSSDKFVWHYSSKQADLIANIQDLFMLKYQDNFRVNMSAMSFNNDLMKIILRDICRSLIFDYIASVMLLFGAGFLGMLLDMYMSCIFNVSAVMFTFFIPYTTVFVLVFGLNKLLGEIYQVPLNYELLLYFTNCLPTLALTVSMFAVNLCGASMITAPMAIGIAIVSWMIILCNPIAFHTINYLMGLYINKLGVDLNKWLMHGCVVDPEPSQLGLFKFLYSFAARFQHPFSPLLATVTKSAPGTSC